MPVATGHCLCRRIGYAFDTPPNWTVYCHCESCRRATSSPVTVWISVPRAALKWSGPEPEYYKSSTGVRRGFCPACGSPMSYENAHLPEEIHLCASSLADPMNVAASRHVFTSDQLPWFEVDDDLPRYDGTSQGGATPVRKGPR